MKKAYALRERVSMREKFYIESHYHDFVTGDMEKSDLDWDPSSSLWLVCASQTMSALNCGYKRLETL
jgi:hypothetical protein